MPDIKTHLRQADHNEHLVAFLEGTPYPDWAVTAIFYSALHHVDAYFHTENIHCRVHFDRDTEIARNRATRPIYKEYGHLKMLSEEARYNGNKPSPQEIKEEALPKLNIIKNHLKQFM